jgi:hypothetical protein
LTLGAVGKGQGDHRATPAHSCERGR